MKTAGDLLTSSAGCWGRVKEKMDDRFVSFFEFLFFVVVVIVLCVRSHLLFSSNSPKTKKKKKLLLADESKTLIVMMSFKLAELLLSSSLQHLENIKNRIGLTCLF